MSGKLATLAAAILITILPNVKAYAVDLTGYWKANDQGTYYMRQIGSVLVVVRLPRRLKHARHGVQQRGARHDLGKANQAHVGGCSARAEPE